VIPDEAVEAAARAAYEFRHGGYKAWDDLAPVEQCEAEAEMRYALRVAAPHLMARAAADLRGWYQERMDEVPAEDVTLTEYEEGREVGVTEGILAASLKIGAEK